MRCARDETEFRTCQLDLVFHGAAERRINLLNHSDHDAALAVGRQLADLLGVPILTAGKRG